MSTQNAPAKHYVPIGTILGIFALGIVLAGACAWATALNGYPGLSVLLAGAAGFGVSVCPIALILQRLDRAEQARVASQAQAIGWSRQEAETARRITEMKAREARA